MQGDTEIGSEAMDCSWEARPAKLARTEGPEQTCDWANVLQVSQHGPVDFGGQVMQYLWSGVEVEFSAPVEYLALLFRNNSEDQKSKVDASKRKIARETTNLLRCSKSLRVDLISQVEARRYAMEGEAPQEDIQVVEEILDEVRDRFPKSSALARSRSHLRWRGHSSCSSSSSDLEGYAESSASSSSAA